MASATDIQATSGNDEVDVCDWSRPSVDENGAYYCVRTDEAHLKVCENQRDD